MTALPAAAGVPRTSRLTGIEAGRGIAALLVVAMHARGHLLKAFGAFPHQAVFAFGHTGVDFFFVLSGFIILHVHRNDIGRPARLGHYLGRRVTRVLPLYLAVLAVSLTLSAVRHPLPSPLALVNAALLLPLPLPLPVPVAWTLQHEAVFYAVFAILIVSRRVGTALFGVWLLLIGCDILAVRTGPGIGRLVDLYSPFDLEFFLGMLAANLVHRVRIPYAWTVLLLGVAGFFGLGVAEDLHRVVGPANGTHLGYGLASMVMVLGLVELERQERLPTPRALLRLGGASYSLYITHLLIIGAAWQLLVLCRLDVVLPVWSQFALLVAGAMLAGIVVSRLIEMPLIGVTRWLLSTAHPRLHNRQRIA